ncbi:sulfatase-like hydrolase/transferase [uncultured Cocleimonas sp.]|uniref:sulfatase-like hydrolase/transferase n=1 Tax=uncultured Cocleimonas sp. TaxID=1051587 RepID=UPI002615934A|nr:sulfatase-like hydrolase/transferase [uncultured Cocleimonas sp.]
MILKILLLLVFIFLTNQGFKFRLDYLIETNNVTTIIVFSILWVFSIFVLLLVTFQQNLLIRIFWALIIAATTAVSYGFYAAGGSELEVLDVLELWQARHETGRAFEHFQHAVIKAAIVAFFGFVIIAYPPPKIEGKLKKLLTVFAWLPIIPVMMFVTLIFIKSDKAVAGLPQQLSPISIATAVGYKLSVQEIPDRKTVDEKPKYAAKVKHLVYLVDESINPDYIYTSPGKLLQSFTQNQDKIANFGTAVSGSNCSARSNAILRLGATRDNLIESVRTSPTIWQYAKKAGFRTVYIDSQASEKTVTKPNDFQNYMTSEEAKLIDKFYKVKNIEGPDLDYRLLEIMEEELKSDKPTFIYANKNGAHFPYDDNYPDSAAIYQPVPSGEESRGLDGLLDLYESGSMEPVINTYKNSIYWTVDKFFEKLFKEVDLSDTAIIYTSDHGQYFEPSSTTHCTSGEDAPATEGLVPLMVITDKKPLLLKFEESAVTNYNVTDQFSLFPTVLDLLGYSEDVQNQYGPDLLDPPTGKVSAFNTGDILGIISKDTIWREVSKEERIKLVPNAPIKPLAN